MPIITKIVPQKNGKRVNIYLDDKFSTKGGPASGWGFGLDLENYVVLGLKVGQELTAEKVEEIVKKAEFQKTYDKILRFASMRPRSRKEFGVWLVKHKIPSSLNAGLFERLERLELIGDKKFASWWVTQRIRFKNKSKRALEMELRQKGVKKEVISEVLSEEQIDEKSMAKKLLKKKERLWSSLDEFTKRRKKSEYLLRNGFSWDSIRDLLNKC